LTVYPGRWVSADTPAEMIFMTDKVFCDTNIFVYAFDSSEEKKHEKANDLIDFIAEFIQISSLSLTTTYRAIELKSKYQLSFWDSLIVSAALEKECSIIYSEDMNDGQIFEGSVKVINPLSEVY
jgi:predicted nucleic acid-binding protein